MFTLGGYFQGIYISRTSTSLVKAPFLNYVNSRCT